MAVLIPTNPLPNDFLKAERRLNYAKTHIFAIPPELTSMIAEKDVFKQRKHLAACMQELMNGECRQMADALCKLLTGIPFAKIYLNVHAFRKNRYRGHDQIYVRTDASLLLELVSRDSYFDWKNRLSGFANSINIYGIHIYCGFDGCANTTNWMYSHKDLDKAAADNQLPIYKSWTKPRKLEMLMECWLSDYCAGDKKRKRA
jgi:hypothetical protein